MATVDELITEQRARITEIDIAIKDMITDGRTAVTIGGLSINRLQIPTLQKQRDWHAQRLATLLRIKGKKPAHRMVIS